MSNQKHSYAGTKRAHLLQVGDIISLGTDHTTDFTVLGVEVQHLAGLGETVTQVRVDIGEGAVYFRHEELVDILVATPAQDLPGAKGRAQTFDQLQANIKGITHGARVDTPAYCEAVRAFGHVYIAELCRLGVIGGGWAAMRNQMTLTDAQSPARRASWEMEACPGEGRYMLAAGPCPDCCQVHVHPKGQGFRQAHQRPTRRPYLVDSYSPDSLVADAEGTDRTAEG
jgi:hypothetical protein